MRKIGVDVCNSGWLSTRILEEYARHKKDLSPPKSLIVAAQKAVINSDWVVLKRIVGHTGAKRIRKWAEANAVRVANKER